MSSFKPQAEDWFTCQACGRRWWKQGLSDERFQDLKAELAEHRCFQPSPSGTVIVDGSPRQPDLKERVEKGKLHNG